MTAINLTELIPRCHEAAQANGWWEPRPNAGQQLMLVVSELSEALEADRNGKQAGLPAFRAYVAGAEQTGEDMTLTWPYAFRHYLKDSVADELADAYIRLCDFAAGFGLNAANMAAHKAGFSLIQPPVNFGAALLQIVRAIDWIDLTDSANGKESRLAQGLAGIEGLCKQRGIDLATHIDLKLTYNATRGHKHGGKAY